MKRIGNGAVWILYSVLLCPSCQKANPSGSRFCGECGHNLTPTAVPPKELDLLQ